MRVCTSDSSVGKGECVVVKRKNPLNTRLKANTRSACICLHLPACIAAFFMRSGYNTWVGNNNHVEVFAALYVQSTPKLPNTHDLGICRMRPWLMMHCKMSNKLLSEMHAKIIRPNNFFVEPPHQRSLPVC